MKLLKTFISIHKNVKVRATKYFFILILAIVSLFLQAYMHNYNIVYIMMFFLVSVAGTSTIFGMLNLYPLNIKTLSNTRFFAGENGKFTLLASNEANHSIYDLKLSYNNSNVKIDSLKSHESKALTFTTVFEKRGKHSLEKLHVESLFPLVHERKFRDYTLDKLKIVVYPKPGGKSLEKQLSNKKDLSGDIDDFKDISRFIDGENISVIHWASLAKNDTLMGKRFIYTQQRQKLYFSFSDINADTEYRLSQLTLWVLEASKLDLDFNLDLGKKTFDSTKEDIDEILTELALY